jgi:hypothetical protein
MLFFGLAVVLDGFVFVEKELPVDIGRWIKWGLPLIGLLIISQAGLKETAKKEILKNAGGKCADCDNDESDILTVHHQLPQVIARDIGLPREIMHSVENGECLCRECHNRADMRSFAHPQEYFDQLAQQYPELANQRGKYQQKLAKWLGGE